MSEFVKRIVLATGGTGGHVFPAQALGRELVAQGYEVFIFSDSRGHLYNDVSFLKVKIPASHFKGSMGQKIKGGIKLIGGVGAALYHLRRLKPRAVIGFGGYASFPTMMAAATLRFPTIVHQADAYFGRVNHFLAPFVTRIATSFPHVENIPTSCQNKVSFTGLPVRPDIKTEPYTSSEKNEPFHILVTGGSQGAKIFGEVIPKAVSLLDPILQKRLHISQQCRSEYIEMTETLYEKTAANVELASFLDHMGERYKRAHLVISRAGASSVVEAALVGRPSLFIPYPYAMDDHQFYNAQQVVNVQGGWVMREKEFTSNALAIYLSELMTSPWKLMQAAANIQAIAVPDASLRLAHLVKLIAV
ncbi:MAG: undecaprenyldiphospho-muramoylpentapeptide beta-N-acetylglucosaminyltransferase [Alphaproteobacteria bacterium 41-28]|nr:MAG: undecaprenyldiphospho-muramoylpentapeptide beta-N-acetylglucosaminyltransferase [Alphaproteobacteria bacterium 41-28]